MPTLLTAVMTSVMSYYFVPIRYRSEASILAVPQRAAQSGGARHPSRTDILEYEVLQETYKPLLTKSQEAMIAATLERRQIGMQLRVVDSAQLPEQPVGPSRLRINVMGGFAGLAPGVVIVGVSAKRRA